MTECELYDDHVCDAVGCFERATTEIKLKVGQTRTINLHVCIKCINKFDQKQRMLEQVGEPRANTQITPEGSPK